LLDTISQSKRSYTMSRIRSKNTKPEMILRSALFREGFRFRLHSKLLPGKPDLVFAKFKTVVFVHGCFWHLHENCRDGRLPKSKLEYWQPKLVKNIERDANNVEELTKLGWKVIIIWECELLKSFDSVIQKTKTILLDR
jgi:DNA mismatch endonuclease (patch repair protein)